MFSLEEAREIGETLGIDWTRSPFDVEQFLAGLEVELEHGRRDPQTDVTHDDPITTGKIALAHLNEFPLLYEAGENGKESRKRAQLTRGRPSILDSEKYGPVRPGAW